MPRIVAIGDNCVDIYTNVGKTFPGGGCVNFAVHANRLGAETAYIGVIGTDAHGDWIAGALATEGVDTRWLMRAEGPTALARVELVGSERTFKGSERGVREQLPHRITPEVDSYIRRFDLLHTTLDGCIDEHIPLWSQVGLKISYDYSHRAKPVQLDLLPYIDVAFFSGQHLDPAAGPAFAKAKQQTGVRLVVVTFGQAGSLAFDGERLYQQNAIPTEPVDTLGAGDSFQAAFIVEYLQSGSVEWALEAGARYAATVCGQFGAFGHEHRSLP